MVRTFTRDFELVNRAAPGESSGGGNEKKSTQRNCKTLTKERSSKFLGSTMAELTLDKDLEFVGDAQIVSVEEKT